jgi:hypothetical protein
VLAPVGEGDADLVEMDGLLQAVPKTGEVPAGESENYGALNSVKSGAPRASRLPPELLFSPTQMLAAMGRLFSATMTLPARFRQRRAART